MPPTPPHMDSGGTVTVRLGFEPAKAKKAAVVTPRLASLEKRFRAAVDSVKSVVHRMAVSSLPPYRSASKRVGVAVEGASSSQRRGNDGDDGGVNGHLVIVVTDTGAGISKENQKLLFREGQQFDPHKLQGGGGSGFGLFISRSIVVMHGGRIKAYSAGEGQGTSFTFTVPMRRTKESMEAATKQRARAVGASSAAVVASTGRDNRRNSAQSHVSQPSAHSAQARSAKTTNGARQAAASRLAEGRGILQLRESALSPGLGGQGGGSDGGNSRRSVSRAPHTQSAYVSRRGSGDARAAVSMLVGPQHSDVGAGSKKAATAGATAATTAAATAASLAANAAAARAAAAATAAAAAAAAVQQEAPRQGETDSVLALTTTTTTGTADKRKPSTVLLLAEISQLRAALGRAEAAHAAATGAGTGAGAGPGAAHTAAADVPGAAAAAAAAAVAVAAAAGGKPAAPAPVPAPVAAA